MGQASMPESTLNRDRLLVLSGIAGAVVIAWVYLFIEAVLQRAADEADLKLLT